MEKTRGHHAISAAVVEVTWLGRSKEDQHVEVGSQSVKECLLRKDMEENGKFSYAVAFFREPSGTPQASYIKA